MGRFEAGGAGGLGFADLADGAVADGLGLFAEAEREELNVGQLYLRAASKMAMPSASEAAMGLSINVGFPALKHCSACSRCGRPSFVSSSTKSTRFKSSSIESTTSTPIFLISSVYLGIRSVLDSISLLPWGYAATTLQFANSGGALSLFRSLVNASECEVSRPMMPIFSGSWATAERVTDMSSGRE